MGDENSVMGFEEFERHWLRRHKGSMVYKPRISSWGLIFGIGLWTVIGTGAAVVSGAHSIPAILQTIPSEVVIREYLSLFGFTIIELLIFAGALYRRDSRIAYWGLVLAMVGALAANIGSSIATVAHNGGDALSLVVAVVLALLPPLSALIAGEMVHLQFAKHKLAIDAANTEYEARRRDLDATINREYSKYVKQFEPVKSASVDVNLRKLPSIDRPTPKMKKAIEWLEQHPEHLDTESRVLADMIGVSHTLANDARKVVKFGLNGNGNGNGHVV